MNTTKILEGMEAELVPEQPAAPQEQDRERYFARLPPQERPEPAVGEPVPFTTLPRAPVMPPPALRSNQTCTGNWINDTACGKCEKCLNEARTIIPHLINRSKRQDEKMALIKACLPRTIGSGDVSTEFKLQCFEEVRRIAYDGKLD
jgi:hypothetical protein